MKENGFRVDRNTVQYIDTIIDAVGMSRPVSLRELAESGHGKLSFFYRTDTNRLVSYIYPQGGKWSEECIEYLLGETSAMGSGWVLTGWPVVSGQLQERIIKFGLETGKVAGQGYLLIPAILVLTSFTIEFRSEVLNLCPETSLILA